MLKSMSDALLNKLSIWFADCPSAVIAFSGGVDSSLVAYLSRLYLGKENTRAIISASPSLKLSDLDEGKRFCLDHDIPIKIIETEELKNPNYSSNPINRCYYCKQTLYTDLTGLITDQWILNGTNLDDLKDYRPGLKAATESKVRSPLAECNLTKEDVRNLAKHFKLQCWDKPASPCMSSRIPYGEQVTLEKLKQIELGEEILLNAGFKISRLRHYGDTAKIEVPEQEVQILIKKQDLIFPAIKKLGFNNVILDEEGFYSGKLNGSIL